ncbi:MAG TPA: hypothetical protein VF157_05870, partial [Chloroflexota bacterium]
MAVQHEPLIPRESIDDFVQETVIPRWVKYGGVVAGAALVMARLAGVAYADGGDHHGHAGDHGEHGDHAVPAHGAPALAHGLSHSEGTPAASHVAGATTVTPPGEAVNNDDHNKVKTAHVAGANATNVTANSTANATNVTAAAATAAANETAGTANAVTAAGAETAAVTAAAN